MRQKNNNNKLRDKKKHSLSFAQKSQAKVIVGFDELKYEEDEYADGNGSEDALSPALRSGALR